MAGPADAARQLTLDLSRDPGFDVEDFLVAPSNAMAFERIDLWPDWTAPSLILIGPPGCGKSHLAAIWARNAGATIVRAQDPIDPVDLAAQAAVLLEDCDRAARPEALLFHLINLMKDANGWLVMTARNRPDQWGLATADLLSRLRLAPVVEVGRPEPDLIRAVLVKLFADRQIRIDADLVTYASLHLEQSLDAVTRFAAAVDDAALSAGRRITRPLVAVTIAALQRGEG